MKIIHCLIISTIIVLCVCLHFVLQSHAAVSTHFLFVLFPSRIQLLESELGILDGWQVKRDYRKYVLYSTIGSPW